jgi:deoxyribodipyrimidine photo-lyase
MGDEHRQRSLREQALARIDALDVHEYERSRNFLDGQVSRLSPFLTHGITDVPEVIARLTARSALRGEDKFLFELAWREYFQHAWRILGEDIWREQKPPPAPTYAQEMPADILAGATGLAIIDAQIAVLYETGYVHNHARLWLASYIVHWRKVDWRTGAHWMYGHLLDGDMASNTLSWQWVAGTWTGKPYLFNAANVAKFAGGLDHSGTVLDASYDDLALMARTAQPDLHTQIRDLRLDPRQSPPLYDADYATSLAAQLALPVTRQWPANFTGPVLHPWALRNAERDIAVGILVPSFHRRYPWSAARWRFVLTAMKETCAAVYIAEETDVMRAAGLVMTSTANPGYAGLGETLAAQGAQLRAAPRACIDPPELQRSFSAFWRAAQAALVARFAAR